MSEYRQSYRADKGFSPPKFPEKIEIGIALDNLVCAECGLELGAREWTIVSTPKHKGAVVFACKDHIAQAMNFLAKMFDGVPSVPANLKLPDGSEN